MLSRAQNTFHHNPRLRGPVSSQQKGHKNNVEVLHYTAATISRNRLYLSPGIHGICLALSV